MKIKKLVAMLATAAMAVGLMVSAPSEAKAADELYVIGDFCGWDWSACATLTSTDGTTYTGDITVTGDTDICIKTVANWDSDADKVTYIYNDSETQQIKVAFASAGTYTMKYNSSTKAVSFTAKSTITVNWTYDYYVAGDATLGAADWAAFDASTAPKMTKNGDVYEYTATCTATTDTVEFKIIKYGTPDVDTVSASTDWIGDPDNGGANYSVATASKIKFTYNPTTGAVTATAVTGSGTTGGTTGGTTTGGTTNNTDTADMAPVAAMLAVAALAAVVVLKKRTVNE